MRRIIASFLLITAVCVLTAKAATPPAVNPLILIGVDGMEWSVVDDLSKKGQLPNITAFRARAATAKMTTDYGANSPIVWTTIATGMNKEKHGITNFDVATDTGTAPVSSTMRKVPAIWNMVSLYKKTVMMLGWWGSWPAESVNGIIVTDRAPKPVENRVSPASFVPTFESDLKAINADRSIYPSDEDSGAEDRIMAHYLVSGAAKGFDLVMGYLHGTDLVSHKYWKYYRPEGFSNVDPDKLKLYADVIPTKYRAVDAVVGKVVAAAPKNANIIIVSDHGFGPLPEEFIKVSLELDPLLVHLGYESKSGTTVDFSKSKFYNYETAGFQMVKMVRFSMAGRENGGTVTPEQQASLRNELSTKLAQVTYSNGSPAFLLRDAKPYEQKKGADFMIEVLPKGASMSLNYQGQVWSDVVKAIVEHSGGHGWLPPAVFMAAGPDINPKADLTGIRIHDVTPTMLYAMALPLAADFDGKAWTTLFSPTFQSAHPAQSIPSYGQLQSAKPTENQATDQEMLDQLRALGYIQ